MHALILWRRNAVSIELKINWNDKFAAIFEADYESFSYPDARCDEGL
jgi:hypothetical protein